MYVNFPWSSASKSFVSPGSWTIGGPSRALQVRSNPAGGVYDNRIEGESILVHVEEAATDSFQLVIYNVPYPKGEVYLQIT